MSVNSHIYTLTSRVPWERYWLQVDSLVNAQPPPVARVAVPVYNVSLASGPLGVIYDIYMIGRIRNGLSVRSSGRQVVIVPIFIDPRLCVLVVVATDDDAIDPRLCTLVQ